MAIETPISLGLSWTPLLSLLGVAIAIYFHHGVPHFPTPASLPLCLRQLHVMKVWSVCCDVMILDTWLFNVSLLDIYTNHDFI